MTLTEISYYSRRLAPLSIIFFLVVLILFYSAKLFFVFLKLQSTSPIQTHTVFGKIKKPFIPDASSSAGLKFILDTVEGEPVSASPAAKVLFLPPSVVRFGYREKVYLTAKTIGFDTDNIKYKIVDRDAVFDDDKQKLTVDISNFNFYYQYRFENTPELFENSVTPEKGASEERAINFLNSVGRYPKELSLGKINTVFLFFDDSKKTVGPTQNSNNANLVEVDFYRPDIEGFPTVTSTYFTSPNYVLFTYDGGEYKPLRAQVHFFELSEDQVGIYPLKTGKEAYEELIGGSGIVISNPSRQTNITIKKMFLGYYDPDIYQEYLQPVYVFLGENNFVAYVPAITKEFLIE